LGQPKGFIVLELRNISFSVPESTPTSDHPTIRTIIDDLTFTFEPGGFYAISAAVLLTLLFLFLNRPASGAELSDSHIRKSIGNHVISETAVSPDQVDIKVNNRDRDPFGISEQPVAENMGPENCRKHPRCAIGDRHRNGKTCHP